jgi:thioredoxin-related protein
MAKRKNCQICGQPIKIDNMEDHMKRVHPKKKGKLNRAKLKDEGTVGNTGVLWKAGAFVIIIVVIIAAAFIFLLGAPADDEEKSLIDTDGNTIKLSDWHGKVVLLDFMGSTCTECQSNTQNVLNPVRQSYGNSIRMLSISTMVADTDQDLINYKAATGANWQFALDTADMKDTYMVASIPTVVILDANGEVSYFHAGGYSHATLTAKIDALANQNRYVGFTVTDTGGTTITLSDWENEVILLDFFQSTCPHCQDNARDVLVPLYTEYGTQIKMLSISIKDDDTNQDLIDFKNAYGAQWQYALDTDGVQQKYGVTATPHTFLIDRSGNIVYSHVGAEDYATLKSEIDSIL